ncbi:hypothetical protein HWV62_44687 [Athelia sp. TMB]|nr:hypothetical protein HWV62_44687 [Athelia sp. TMB]
MGVNGLWDILAPAARVENLAELVIREGFALKEDRTFCMGIDISVWLEALQRTAGLHISVNTGQNAVLKAFFWRLTHLLSLPLAIIFVFDGPDRPKLKRGKQVKGTPHWMETATKALIEAFGFQHVTALGEAEAELASMNEQGLIHVVVTDDADAFVFGASSVMRTWNERLDKGAVTLYRAVDIRAKVHNMMTREGLVLFALLTGGDYDKGVENCGKSSSFGAVKYGLGAELHAATLSLDVQGALATWRDHLREVLASDPEGIAGGRRPTAANNIEDTFPDRVVLTAYMAPLCSPANGLHQIKPTLALPNLTCIAKLCQHYFDWATPDMSQKLSEHVWPGTVLRMILADITAADALRATETSTNSTPPAIPAIIRKRNTRGIPELKVAFPSASLAEASLAMLEELPVSLEKRHLQDESDGAAASFEVWIPSAIFETWIAGRMSPQLLISSSEVEDKPPLKRQRQLSPEAHIHAAMHRSISRSSPPPPHSQYHSPGPSHAPLGITSPVHCGSPSDTDSLFSRDDDTSTSLEGASTPPPLYQRHDPTVIIDLMGFTPPPPPIATRARSISSSVIDLTGSSPISVPRALVGTVIDLTEDSE